MVSFLPTANEVYLDYFSSAVTHLALSIYWHPFSVLRDLVYLAWLGMKIFGHYRALKHPINTGSFQLYLKKPPRNHQMRPPIFSMVLKEKEECKLQKHSHSFTKLEKGTIREWVVPHLWRRHSKWKQVKIWFPFLAYLWFLWHVTLLFLLSNPNNPYFIFLY